jgi:hypothetical protein
MNKDNRFQSVFTAPMINDCSHVPISNSLHGHIIFLLFQAYLNNNCSVSTHKSCTNSINLKKHQNKNISKSKRGH